MKKPSAFLFLPFFLFHPFSFAANADTPRDEQSYLRDQWIAQQSHVAQYRQGWRVFRAQESNRSNIQNTDSSDASGTAPTPVIASDTSVQTPPTPTPDIPDTGAPPGILPSSITDAVANIFSSEPSSLGASEMQPRTTSPEIPNSGNQETADTSTRSGSIFSTGAITFRFDDGWESQIENAVPVLDAAGFKGSFYIVTRQTQDDGFTGFMSHAQIQGLASAGHEIGAHSRTHGHLPTMSESQKRDEIRGSLEDLAALGIKASTFSYPYGEYDSRSVQIVGDSGYTGGMTTEETFATQNSRSLEVPSPSIRVNQSVSEIKNLIDQAIASHGWLTLSFHRIDYSGDEYSITPENFRTIVEYVKDRGIRVISASAGIGELQ